MSIAKTIASLLAALPIACGAAGVNVLLEQLEADLADRDARLSSLEKDAANHVKAQREWETVREQLEAERNQLREALQEHAAEIERLRAVVYAD